MEKIMGTYFVIGVVALAAMVAAVVAGFNLLYRLGFKFGFVRQKPLEETLVKLILEASSWIAPEKVLFGSGYKDRKEQRENAMGVANALGLLIAHGSHSTAAARLEGLKGAEKKSCSFTDFLGDVIKEIEHGIQLAKP
jgi:hypothetical protein